MVGVWTGRLLDQQRAQDSVLVGDVGGTGFSEAVVRVESSGVVGGFIKALRVCERLHCDADTGKPVDFVGVDAVGLVARANS